MFSYIDLNLIVIVGAALQISAMLFRNQIILRTLFILGGICYILFYIYGLPEPLWQAALATTSIASTTAIGLLSILIGRSTIIIPKDLIGLYKKMGGIRPGEFRQLLRYGERRRLETSENLTVQDQIPKKLYFIESGRIEAHKNGHVFSLPSGIFIGEIAFLTDVPASATIQVSAGSDIVEWDGTVLRKAVERNEKLKIALDARLATDLAAKVKSAVGSANAADNSWGE